MALIGPALVALAFAAVPALRVEGGLPAEAAAEAERGWVAAEALLAAAGVAPPPAPRPLRIGPADGLPPGQAAVVRAGLIGLRPGPFDERARGALRHEAAHALLLEACPPAAGDPLFHETFALLASGELAEWAQGEGGEEGRYLPLVKALDTLDRARSLDGRGARRALARLLAESPPAPGRLPPALDRRLARCEPGARWEPLAASELADDRAPAADALVVISRHSGELLQSSGGATLPLPFGSTLKPFMVAGASGTLPVAARRRFAPRLALRGGAARARRRRHRAASLVQRLVPRLGRSRSSGGDARAVGPGAGRARPERAPRRRRGGDRRAAVAPDLTARAGGGLSAPCGGAPRPRGRPLTQRARGDALEARGLGTARWGGAQDGDGLHRGGGAAGRLDRRDRSRPGGGDGPGRTRAAILRWRAGGRPGEVEGRRGRRGAGAGPGAPPDRGAGRTVHRQGLHRGARRPGGRAGVGGADRRADAWRPCRLPRRGVEGPVPGARRAARLRRRVRAGAGAVVSARPR